MLGDTDGDGKISDAELQAAEDHWKELGITIEERKRCGDAMRDIQNRWLCQEGIPVEWCRAWV
ncbi:MAG: hypothetical protein F4117_00675 [Acidimicrobiales bacterium]|nr:hypothetical protein [Acidimicrobiales bacterium]MXZ15679.1 hypothetical protein [Acidimicrobiales bacterium]MYG61181.1 hypothetical protein [Acidimicrobiales bacterium]MYI11066.1 hypothetical protein [Acidimicrobiales bacterium]